MLDIEEAMVEQAKAKAREEQENRISMRLPSFKLSQHRAVSKHPSFFKKMFSMRNMDKVFNGDDEESNESGSQIGFGDEDLGGHQTPIANGSDEGTDADGEREKSSKKAEVVEMDSKYAYYDPPMPKVGQPVDMDLLINRNKRAEFGLEKLMDMVHRDTKDSLSECKDLPVSKGFDRIYVTEEQSARIGRVRTNRHIDNQVQKNVQHIQKALNYRKSAIIMMNSNYSHQLVRHIEPIYVNEARTITKRAGDLGAPKDPDRHQF
jgi:hypothetical protein